MKLLDITVSLLVGSAALTAAAQDTYMHVFCNDSIAQYATDSKTGQEYITGYIGSFGEAPLQSLDSVSFTKTNKEISRLKLTYVTPDGKSRSPKINLSAIDRITFGPNPAEFQITIPDAGQMTDVTSKTQYLDGHLTINGFGVCDDFDGDIKVRGRGNSTWNMPKKAYRIKLPEKTKLCGYRKAKNYVLLANYIDLSMMRNEVAALATQLVGMPYPTHAKPVNVYFNSKYKGSYMLMEKVGINNGSVNIPAAQEAESIMFELDVNFDEELKTISPYFHLPLQHKDPDAPANIAEAKTWFGEWANDFFEMEKAVYNGNNIGDYIDYETLAKFLIVFNIACNQEINHPKSIYLYKTKGGKYQFGPCWDFDWAYGYSPTYRAMGEDMTREEAERLLNELQQFCVDSFGPFGGAMWFRYNGQEFIWYGDNQFYIVINGTILPYPEGAVPYAPTYYNYLLGTGKNNGNIANGYYDAVGNGGEFFLSIVKDNPEFMEVYKQVWDSFYSNIDAFWEAFDAYAAELEPSAAKNHTIWPYVYTSPTDHQLKDLTDGTYAGAIRALRRWLELRIEFLNNPDNNYGLFDPSLNYKRGNLSTSK